MAHPPSEPSSPCSMTIAPDRASPAVLFGLFYFGYYGYIGLLSPYISLYFAHRHFSALEIASLMSVIQFTRIGGPYFWAWLADRLQARVAVLRVAAWGAWLVFALVLYLQSYHAFFIWMVVLNSIASAITPVGEALVVQTLARVGYQGFDRRYGRLRMWGSIGFIVTVLAGGACLQQYGMDSLPWLALILLGMLSLVTLRLREVHRTESLPVAETAQSAEHHPVAREKIWPVLKQGDVQWFLVSTFCMIFAHAALYVFYSLHLAQLGYGKFAIGAMWTIGVAAEILFFFFQGAVFGRWSLRTIQLACFGLATVRFLLIGYGGTSMVVLVGAQILHAATFAAHHSSSLKLLQRWFAGPLQARGQALFTSVSYGLGGTLGGLLMGLIWEAVGASLVYASAAAVALMGVIAVHACFAWRPPCQAERSAAPVA